jgi:hypothetical protein
VYPGIVNARLNLPARNVLCHLLQRSASSENPRTNVIALSDSEPTGRCVFHPLMICPLEKSVPSQQKSMIVATRSVDSANVEK